MNEDDEHDSIRVVKISEIFAVQDDLFLEKRRHLTEYECSVETGDGTLRILPTTCLCNKHQNVAKTQPRYVNGSVAYMRMVGGFSGPSNTFLVKDVYVINQISDLNWMATPGRIYPH